MMPRNPAPAGTQPRVVAVTLVVVLGSITTIMDMTIVNVALARLSQVFHAPVATIQWTATAYTLALASMIPVTAWAVGRFGAKRAYMGSIAMFTLGSALAGLAWSAESLIGFRVLQGLGGGMITPVGMTVIVRAAEPGRRGRAMSFLGIPVLIGPLAGPILGGWLIDNTSWRWIFLINLPLGALTLALAARIFPRDTPSPGHRLDLPGLLMLSPGLAALLYGLATGGARGDFRAAEVLVPTLLGAALVAGFVVRALTAPHPLIDLRVFRQRSFAPAAATLALFACAYFGSMLLLPLYYQLVRGESATGSGLVGIPQVLATGITMQIAGRLIDKVAPGKLVPTGVILAFAGYLTFTVQVDAGSPYWTLIAPLAVAGVGVGMTMMPAITAAVRDFSHEQIPVATTALNIVQQISSGVGTALISVLFATALADRVPGIGEDGLGMVRALPPSARHEIAPPLADAFQYPYVWTVALMGAALLPALLLPGRRPQSRGRGTDHRTEPTPARKFAVPGRKH